MTTITMISIDSPTFNSHSANTMSGTANRVVNDNDFSFSNDETRTSITTTADNKTKSNTKNTNEDEIEFEFPIEEHISPRFPLFDRTLLLDLNRNSKSETDSKPVPAPEAPFSLIKLLIEARDSGSCSSSDADELDGITPETYCVWNPKESRGKHKKSNSVSIGNSSKRWNVRDLVKRSYSDDSYSTGNVTPALLFSPPISPKPKVKDDSGVGARVVSTETVNKVPAYKGKIGNMRFPAYYPYRHDQIAAFGNFNESSTNPYRY